MKKLLVLVTLLLTGCNIQTTNNTTQEVANTKTLKVHLFETNKCYEIESYNTYESQVRARLVDYGEIYLSLYNCMIIKDKCPICEEVKSDE